MEEELVTLKTKLEDLDQKFLSLHLQHLAMSNQRHDESSETLGSLLLATFVG